jgi:tellurite resistance protein
MSEPLLADEKGCLRRVLVAMMVADGDIDDDELAMVVRVYAEIAGETVDPDVLRGEGSKMQAEGITLSNCLRGLVEPLDADARRRVFGAAFAVASADGFVLDEEDALLANVAAALGYTQAQYQSEIDRLMGN